MLHIKETISTISTLPNLPNDCFQFLQYFAAGSFGVLDIETTGLSPHKSKMILGGLISYIPSNINNNGGDLMLEQFFAENPEDEPAVLRAYIEAISKLDTVVTFNGKHFDMPFIEQRAKKCDISLANYLPHNLDLYLLLNKYSELRKLLPNLKQKTVEDYYGLWQYRNDEISGKESVELYYDYCESRSKVSLEKILLHNRDDLLQLYRLIPILSKTDVHKGLYYLGFPSGDLSVTKVRTEKSDLIIEGIQRKNATNYRSFDDGISPYTMFFNASSKSFEIRVPIYRSQGLALIDLKKFNFDYNELKRLPNFENDYIIIENKGVPDYLVTNMFARLLLSHIRGGTK